jgi:glycosyltransferase involved in cell wall biosynthesis
MNTYIISNYSPLNAKSMFLYARLLKRVLKNNKYKPLILQPPVILNKFNFNNELIHKWLGYIDNYILFGFYLLFKIKKNDFVHICDHSNALLYAFIKTKNIIITCNDLTHINLIDDDKFHKLSFNGKLFQKIILYNLNKFRTVLCISQHTKNDLIKKISIKKKKIYAVHMPLNQNFFPVALKNKKKFLDKKKIVFKYFLHVGSNAWNKNKLNLIKIFYEFEKISKNTNHKLILIGSGISNDLNNLIIKLNLKKKILNFKDVSHNDLRTFYSAAECLIFPSIKEGFGWPIIEAQKCGCPVFTTDKAPMNELGLDSVYYIDPFNSKKSAFIIKKKLNHRNLIIKKGFINIDRFDFNKFSKKMIKIYNNILIEK